MSETNIERSLGRIEGQLEGIERSLKTLAVHDRRIRSLEHHRSKMLGWTAAVSGFISIIITACMAWARKEI